MGGTCWMVLALVEKCSPGRPGNTASLVITAVVSTVAISALTPLLWTTWRPIFLPWELETYINGVHNLGQPQAWLFPIFPWTAFAFAGLAFGFIVMSERGRQLGWRIFGAAAIAGIILIYTAKFLDSRSLQVYPVFDFWHTSPEFYMIRLGLLLLLVLLAYAWCRWGFGQKGF